MSSDEALRPSAPTLRNADSRTTSDGPSAPLPPNAGLQDPGCVEMQIYCPCCQGIFTCGRFVHDVRAQLLMAMGTLSSWNGQFHE